MDTVIALFRFAPLVISVLLVLAVSGLFAGFMLAKAPERTAKISLALLLASAALVPAAFYLSYNYWLAVHRNPHPMALNQVLLNPESLEILYFLWWVVTSLLLWAAVIWRKWRAA